MAIVITTPTPHSPPKRTSLHMTTSLPMTTSTPLSLLRIRSKTSPLKPTSMLKLTKKLVIQTLRLQKVIMQRLLLTMKQSSTPFIKPMLMRRSKMILLLIV